MFRDGRCFRYRRNHLTVSHNKTGLILDEGDEFHALCPWAVPKHLSRGFASASRIEVLRDTFLAIFFRTAKISLVERF